MFYYKNLLLRFVGKVFSQPFNISKCINVDLSMVEELFSLLFSYESGNESVNN